MKRVFHGADRKKANLVLTILASQSINAQLTALPSGKYEIRVPVPEQDRARHHLERYALENRPFARQIAGTSPSSFYSPATLVIIGILVLVHAACIHTGLHDQAVFKFGASSYFIRQGDAFRAITALFLHSDARHLLGNMAGLIVFAAPLVRLTGFGTGPFLLLCAGTTGNLLSNGLGQGAGISIGASTAVMAAAGMLGARQVLVSRNITLIKTLAPLAAGATLMAMFSHGERTDVSAHFFGFGAGVGVGMIGLPLVHAWPGPRIRLDALALVLVVAILAAALVQGGAFAF